MDDFALGLTGAFVTVFLLEGLSLSRGLDLGFLESCLSGLLGWVVESESVLPWVGFGDDDEPLANVRFLVRETLAASLLPGGTTETYVLVSSITFPSSSASSMYVRGSAMVGDSWYRYRLIKVSLVESWMKSRIVSGLAALCCLHSLLVSVVVVQSLGQCGSGVSNR